MTASQVLAFPGAPSKLVAVPRAKYPGKCPGCAGPVQQGAPFWYAPQAQKGRKLWCVPCGDQLTGTAHADAKLGAPLQEDESDPFASAAPAVQAQAPILAPKPVSVAKPAPVQAGPVDPLAAAIAAAVAPLLAEARQASLDTDAARAIAREELAKSLRRLRRAGAGDTGPEPVTWIPEREPDYDPDTSTGRMLRACIESASHCWVSGPSGSGKTYPALQEAAALGRPVMLVSCTDGMDRSSLLGSWILEPGKRSKDGQGGQPAMRWLYGPLPRAMASGAFLVLDEADKLAPALSAILFGVTDPGKPRSLLIPECGREIAPAPGFAVACTGNTLRDNSGRYSGQRPDAALVNRFLHVPADYLPTQTETRILKFYAPNERTAARIAQALSNLRPAHDLGQVDTPPSLRVGITCAKLLSGRMPSGSTCAPFPWDAAWSASYVGSLENAQAVEARKLIGGAP